MAWRLESVTDGGGSASRRALCARTQVHEYAPVVAPGAAPGSSTGSLGTTRTLSGGLHRTHSLNLTPPGATTATTGGTTGAADASAHALAAAVAGDAGSGGAASADRAHVGGGGGSAGAAAAGSTGAAAGATHAAQAAPKTVLKVRAGSRTLVCLPLPCQHDMVSMGTDVTHSLCGHLMGTGDCEH